MLSGIARQIFVQRREPGEIQELLDLYHRVRSGCEKARTTLLQSLRSNDKPLSRDILLLFKRAIQDGESAIAYAVLLRMQADGHKISTVEGERLLQLSLRPVKTGEADGKAYAEVLKFLALDEKA